MDHQTLIQEIKMKKVAKKEVKKKPVVAISVKLGVKKVAKKK
jgi:hypothetical protein